MSAKPSVVVIGGGPAGLTAAYLLSKEGVPVTVLESDPVYLGGISRTAVYKNFHFDIGGHRFFSKSKEVEDLWTEILGNDLIVRPRLSRIFYRGKFFAYPMKPVDAFFKLGPIETVRCVLSYVGARLKPIRNPKNFEEWVSNQFGARLYNIFFKTYTEKVWGIPCREISADWAAQRIRGLSLSTTILHALGFGRNKGGRDKVIKTLIESFRYPRKGPGMMWEVCAKKTEALGGKVLLGKHVTGCHWDSGTRRWTVSARAKNGAIENFEADHVICSAPLRELVDGVTPALPAAAKEAASALRYRDFLVVALIVRDPGRFHDNWVYIHDPSVKVGRIQNFKSWSPEMVPDPEFTCYGMEYFCFEGDGLWTAPDAALIQQAREELRKVGLVRGADIVDGCVVRQKKAYPVYDEHYLQHVAVVREALETAYPTLHVVGRNGMHKYNNQDHAMMTAMLTAKNIVAGRKVFDPWLVNQDAEYHEAGSAGQSSVSGLRDVPQRVKK
jgi:protoporphyrinogen oxidase